MARLLRLSNRLILAGIVMSGCETTAGHVVGQDSLSFGLRFSTYLGGSGTDMIRDVAIDSQGNIYAAGSTRSPNFPTTAGVLQPVYNPAGTNSSDAFITKFSPTGQILWSTFLGGPGYERIYAVEVDEQGFAYVAGRAGPGFPVTPGAFQTTFGGDNNPQGGYGPEDGFVCKIRPDGTQIVFCSYFGNEDFQPIRDLAIDANHDIYIGSSTPALGNFPAAWFTNAYQRTIRGQYDGLIAKLKGDGSRVEWATLLGGSGEESVGFSLQVDPSGVYFATTTTSTDLPTPNGFSHTLNGPSDLYVGKLSPDGTSLLYATYVGGSGAEATETHHLAVDPQGGVVLGIATPVTDFPVTTGVFQSSGAGKSDALIVRLTPSGGLAAASYLGGSDADWIEGIAIDATGNAFVTGISSSTDFPVTGGVGPSGGDALIGTAVARDFTRLLFSRRLGGSGQDYGRTIAVSGSLFVVAGMSSSPNFPLTNPAQPALAGGEDGILVVFGRVP